MNCEVRKYDIKILDLVEWGVLIAPIIRLEAMLLPELAKDLMIRETLAVIVRFFASSE